jgi:iron(III) transport system permease protein
MPTLRRFHLSFFFALVLVLVLLVPLAVLSLELANIDADRWASMWQTFLPRVLWNTFSLALGVGLGAFLLGTGLAALIAAYDFPGRRWLDRLLLLPLAMPGFIMGFVYVSIFEYAGPVQSSLRAWFGWKRGQYWFPDIASPLGLMLVLTLVLYPYVYLMARAAFHEQAASTFEAARLAGLSRPMAFVRLALPMAFPNLAAGTILVVLETLTDYGTVSYFGYPTLSERIIVMWNTEFNPSTATQLALLMMLAALALLALERRMRNKARFYQQGSGRKVEPRRLVGPWRWLPTLFCGLVLGAAFVLPVSQLVIWAATELATPTVSIMQDAFLEYSRNSVLLAGGAALSTAVLAMLVAYAARRTSIASRRGARLLSRLLTLGYAMPGAVIAIGVLVVVNPIDSAVSAFASDYLGWANAGYLLTGTPIALLYAYVVRFMSISFNSADASLGKISPNLESAARTAGARSWRILAKIHFPLMRTGLAAGLILVFVDVMKELPATLLLRPFGMDTLALRTYFLSVEGWHRSAAIPALMILLVGLLPVFVLMRVGAKQL